MRDKLIEMLANAFDERTVKCLDCFDNDECLDRGYCDVWTADIADYLIARGVTIGEDTNVLGKKPLTIAESADLERIRISIERKCLDMAQPGMWERYTRHMECGEVRELAQYYRDMGLVYKLITGYELPWPPKEVE